METGASGKSKSEWMQKTRKPDSLSAVGSSLSTKNISVLCAHGWDHRKLQMCLDANIFLPLGFSERRVLKENCLSWPATVLLAAVTAKCKSTRLHPGAWAEGWGRHGCHDSEPFTRRRSRSCCRPCRLPGENKNEKLQPVLPGKSLGLIWYKEKAQRHLTRDPCPAGQA